MRSAVAVVIALAGCSAPPQSEVRRDPAPRAQAEAPSEPESEPEAEVVAEEPAPAEAEPALEVLRGRASYYSDRLAGRRTANGDVYDPRALTAASRDLPFGTRVRVIREDTGASVIVRINDRGPHRDQTRILDLSRAAAEALDMIRAGVIDVRAEIIERP